MDVHKALRELYQEKKRLDAAILVWNAAARRFGSTRRPRAGGNR